jgi:hypothetical protein
VHIRAVFLVAVAVIVGLTVAVVVLATNNGSSTAGISATGINSTATSGSAAAIYANAVSSEELGAKLDHSGRNIPSS